MSCICCYFDNEYQKELKNTAKGLTFEIELLNYKSLFMRELFSLSPIELCDCKLSLKITNKNMKKYILDVEAAIKEGRIVKEVNDMFEEAIAIYKFFIQGKHLEAINKAKAIFSQPSIANNLFVSRPLFRARTKGVYDKKEIREYFHVPFDKRSIVPRQRFSVAEQPMLYLAGSVRTALAELKKTVEEVEIAAFMPSFSCFHNSAGCNFIVTENEFDVLFNEILPVIFDAGSKLRFDTSRDAFCYEKLPQILKKTVLYQLMTYPNKNTDDSFVSAYVLPQIFTQAFSNDANAGIIYQSTKSSVWKNSGPSSPLDRNVCFFVHETSNLGYNESLLSKFSYATYDPTITRSVKEFEMLITKMLEWCKAKNEQGYNMIDWVLYCHNAQAHIEKISFNNPAYFSSNEGLYEINLLYRLYEKLYIEAREYTKALLLP